MTGFIPSGEAQRIERENLERKTCADVETLIAIYQRDGKQATIAEFDRIAKRRKMKNFEAHMLIIGFQRECKARGIEL